MYVFSNPNPSGQFVGDCVIRAISIATNQTWDDVYIRIAMQGYCEKNMPSANAVWGSYLETLGYKRYPIFHNGTIEDFCKNNPVGSFVLGTGTHVVAVKNGDWFDAWDSGREFPIYYFKR